MRIHVDIVGRQYNFVEMDGYLISTEMFSPTSGALYDCRSVLELYATIWEQMSYHG